MNLARLFDFWRLQKRRQILVVFVSGLIIFLIGFGYRAAYISTAVVDKPVRADAQTYVIVANNIVNKGIYSSQPEGDKSIYLIPPGYPLFLAVVMKVLNDGQKSYQFVLWVQAIISALTAVVSMCIALRIVPLVFSLVVGFLVAFSPHLVVMSGYLLTETLFAFFLALSIYISLVAIEKNSWASYFLGGVLFGLAALVRPSILLFPPLAIAIVYILRKDLRHSLYPLAMILGLFVSWGSWTTWTVLNPNQIESTGSLATKAFAFGIYPDFTYKSLHYRGYPYREDPDYNTFSNSFHEAAGVLIQRASADPGKYIKWYLWGKAATFWSPDILVGQGDVFVYPVVRSLYDISPEAEVTKNVMQALHPVVVQIAFLSSLLVPWLYREKLVYQSNVICFILILAMLFYITAVHVVLAPLPRYSIPFRIGLYIAFVSGCYFFWEHRSKILSQAASILTIGGKS